MKKTILAVLVCVVLTSLFVFAASAEDASEPVKETESTAVVSKAENEGGAVEDLEISFDPAGFLTHIGKMGFGMVGIFIVIGVIVVITYVLNKVSTGKKKE